MLVYKGLDGWVLGLGRWWWEYFGVWYGELFVVMVRVWNCSR